MIDFTEHASRVKIIIEVASMDEIVRYQRGILGILAKIEVDNCDPVLIENIKSVYDLLSHLNTDKKSI